MREIAEFLECPENCLPVTSMVVVIGTISASSRPSAWAWAVRCCDCRAYSSCRSRSML